LWLRPRYRLCSSLSRSRMARSYCMACVIGCSPGGRSPVSNRIAGTSQGKGRLSEQGIQRDAERNGAMAISGTQRDRERFDVIVAGAGYVGLAVAVSIAQARDHLAIAVVDAAPEGTWRKDG